MHTDVPSATRYNQGTYSKKSVENDQKSTTCIKSTIWNLHQQHQYIHLPSSNHGRLTHLVRLVTLPPPDVSIQHRTRSEPGVVTGLFKTYFINTQKIEDVWKTNIDLYQ